MAWTRRRSGIAAATMATLAALAWLGQRANEVAPRAFVAAPARQRQVADDSAGPLPPHADPAALLAAANPMGDMAYGDPAAPVTVVEYASLSCVHCNRFHDLTFPVLKARYVDRGLVRWIVREYAGDSVSTGGLMLARCVGKDPKGTAAAFEAIMRVQPFYLDPREPATNVPAALFKAVGPSFGLTHAAFSACISDMRTYDAVNKTYKDGRDLFKVAETPTFFVDGDPIVGNQEAGVFADALDRHLGRLLPAPSAPHANDGSLAAWNAMAPARAP